MAFEEVLKQFERTISENSTAILTGVGVTGTVTTAYLTGRASIKSYQLWSAEEQDRFNTSDGDREYLSKTDTVKLVWREYIPAVGVGSVTIASIIMANRLASKKATALAAAYGLSEKAFTEYKEKVVEKLGDNKERAIRDEIAQDRVNANPPPDKTVIIGSGEVLCLDNHSGRYFNSSVDVIKRAENTINHEILNHMYTSLSSFYDEIGLPATSHSDEVGWNSNNLLELTFSTALAPDQRPCVVIDFQVAPITGYGNLY